jgi:hypothetical protein
MKLINLVEYLVDPEKLEELYRKENLNIESEALLIYMHGDLSIDSEIIFFEIEETEDDLVYEKDGSKYIQFFPVNYAVELIETDLGLKGKGYSDLEIANRLLEYRIKDA